MTRAFIPQDVLDLAHARSAARAARDWPEADRIRAKIEEAGWTVIDSGTNFRLDPVGQPIVELDGAIRYGRSDAVPSRLDEPDAGTVTVVLVAPGEARVLARAMASIDAHAPAAAQVVIVADAPPEGGVSGLPDDRAEEGLPSIEVLRTSVPLGEGAALNIGLRRATGAVIAFMDARLALTGNALSPLIEALADPGVAVVGASGVRTDDLRQFDDVSDGAAIAIRGDLLAFRRIDARIRGPLDEAFRVPRHLDTWWSLVLRDEGPESPPRRAVALAGLPVARLEGGGGDSHPEADGDRLAKRNFYRLLDRFRDRPDLLHADG